MKKPTHEPKEPSELILAPLSWFHYRLLVIETILLMVLFVVLGVLRLDYAVEELWRACYQHVPLLVTCLVIFGAYRAIEATNAVKLFTSYALSFLLAGAMFLLWVRWLSESIVSYWFDMLFLFVAFFMLNSIRPLILKCTER